MTVLEAYKFKVGNGISDSAAAAALSFAGVNPDDTWSPDYVGKCAFYAAVIGALSAEGMGVSSITEGGYSITYNKDEKNKHLQFLAEESGCKELIAKYTTGLKVQNISNRW